MSKNLNPKISIFENPYIPMSKNLNTLISKNPNPNIPIYGEVMLSDQASSHTAQSCRLPRPQYVVVRIF